MLFIHVAVGCDFTSQGTQIRNLMAKLGGEYERPDTRELGLWVGRTWFLDQVARLALDEELDPRVLVLSELWTDVFPIYNQIWRTHAGDQRPHRRHWGRDWSLLAGHQVNSLWPRLQPLKSAILAWAEPYCLHRDTWTLTAALCSLDSWITRPPPHPESEASLHWEGFGSRQVYPLPLEEDFDFHFPGWSCSFSAPAWRCAYGSRRQYERSAKSMFSKFVSERELAGEPIRGAKTAFKNELASYCGRIETLAKSHGLKPTHEKYWKDFGSGSRSAIDGYLSHFYWLALYQCARMPVGAITSKCNIIGNDDSVYRALRRTADEIKLSLRRQRRGRPTKAPH